MEHRARRPVRPVVVEEHRARSATRARRSSEDSNRRSIAYARSLSDGRAALLLNETRGADRAFKQRGRSTLLRSHLTRTKCCAALPCSSSARCVQRQSRPFTPQRRRSEPWNASRTASAARCAPRAAATATARRTPAAARTRSSRTHSRASRTQTRGCPTSAICIARATAS
jgi:hypothetical protein